MNAPQLPAYLQNKTRTNLAAVATAGMGSAMPNHISIRGNQFTLIDEAGAKMPLGALMDAIVVDITDHIAKRYYEEPWKDGSDNPPDCWSMNGIGPSRGAMKPQSQTCGDCEWNVRGSDTSALSGKPIKACRDEKPIALLLPQYPQMLFQLIIPPGSFKNWTAFTKQFSGGIDVSDVLIRFGFEPQKNGVMTFTLSGYMPENLVPVFNNALASKATDALVGRTDVPIAALPAPAREIASMVTLPANSTPGQVASAFADLRSAQVQQSVPFGSSAVPPAGVAVVQATSVAPTAATTSPSEQPVRRRRRTNAQIEADKAASAARAGEGRRQPAPQAPFPVQPNGFGGAPTAPVQAGTFGQPASAATAPTAGFGQEQQPAQQANFGIQNAGEPDPQLAAMLASLNQPGT